MSYPKITVSNLSPEHKRRLNKLAYELLGETNLSALVRWIAEQGYIENELIHPESNTPYLVVPAPASKDEQNES